MNLKLRIWNVHPKLKIDESEENPVNYSGELVPVLPTRRLVQKLVELDASRERIEYNQPT